MLLGAAACGLFLGGTFRSNRHLWAAVALAAVAVAAVAHFLTAHWTLSPDDTLAAPALFNGPLNRDALAGLVRLMALGGGLVLVLFSWNEVPDRQAADYFGCLLLIVAGVS